MKHTTFVQLLDLAVGAVLVTSFAALWLRRLVTVTRVIAIQGFALAGVAAVIGVYEHLSLIHISEPTRPY